MRAVAAQGAGQLPWLSWAFSSPRRLLLPPVQMDLRQAQAAIATVEKRLQGEMPVHFSRPCQLCHARIVPASSTWQ